MQRTRQGDTQALVAALADPARRAEATRALDLLGPSARAAVREGLGDGRWEVRRQCAFWLLRAPAPDDVPALVPLLRDPRSKVRHAAVIAVGHGRGPDCTGEVVPLLIERVLHDESPRVRRQALSLLAWSHAHPDLESFFAGLLETERDRRLHRWAGVGLLRCRAMSKPMTESGSC